MYLHLQEYLRPQTIEACLDGLSRERSAALGGGSYLNARGSGHERLEQVVDLQGLGLGGIAVDGDALRLGAAATVSELAVAELPAGLEALTQAAQAEKNRAVRNVSTIGGRVCRDTADARLLTALVALDAEVALTVRDADGEVAETRVAIEAFAGPDWQQTRRGSYLVTAVFVPIREGRSAYRDFAMTAVDTPYADAAVFVGGGATRVAVGGLGATAAGVVRAPEAEAAARRGEGWQTGLKAALEPTLPSYTTPRAGGEYRRDVATTLVVRLLEEVTA